MRLRTWVRRSVTILVLVALVNAGISILLRSGRAHRYLTARLAESFGRPVEVERFGFSVVDGLRLSVVKITVREDPRFGEEYFLRAEQLTAGLRWKRLLTGKFEFGTLSFSRPSLNLVRTSDGRWNLESWLPTVNAPTAAAGSMVSLAPRESGGRLYKIEIDGGRINLKNGADKRPFALGDVNGSVEQEGAGRWRLDLESRPMRAGVTLQQPGTLRVFGRVAGTSARLQPAELYAKWADASIADLLRLADGQDYGVRGLLTLELTARSHSGAVQGWIFTATARATQVHRWDLAERPSNPAVNLRAEAVWDVREPRLKLTAISAEAARSRMDGTGNITWQTGIEPEFQFQTSGIAFADLFEGYRAFRPGTSEQTSVDGYVSGRFTVRGWPPRAESAEFKSKGVKLNAAGLRGPVVSDEFSGGFRGDWLGIDSLTLHLPGSNALNPHNSAVSEEPPKNRASTIKGEMLRGDTEFVKLSARVSQKEKLIAMAAEGETSHAEDILLMMKGMGHAINSHWNLTGPVRWNLRRNLAMSGGRPISRRATTGATADSGDSQPVGWAQLQDAQLRIAGLNLPLQLADILVEWKDGERTVLVRSARGLGAQWTGTLAQRQGARDGGWEPWKFDFTADHMSAVELDRWIGPRARRGFLERLLPGLASGIGQPGSTGAATDSDEPVKNIRADGRVAIENLSIEPINVRKLTARVRVDGRRVRLDEAEGEFYGGKVTGSFDANLNKIPEYVADAEIDRVNLSALAATAATLQERFAGFASARIHLSARGIGREDLGNSLEARGEFIGSGIQVRGLDLKAAMTAKTLQTGMAQWPSAEGLFAINFRGIRITRLRLKDGATNILAEGTIDFSHALDMHARAVDDSVPSGLPIRQRAIHLTGTLEEPRFERMISRVEATPASN